MTVEAKIVASARRAGLIKEGEEGDIIVDTLSQSGAARVYRVHFPFADGLFMPASAVLKLLPRNEGDRPVPREVSFYCGGLPPELPPEAHAPALLGADENDEYFGLWLADVSIELQTAWAESEARQAVRKLALLSKVSLARGNRSQGLPWMATAQHRRYAEQLPDCVENLRRLEDYLPLRRNLAAADFAKLGNALDTFDAAETELRALPQCLLHGSSHPGNLGLDNNGNLVLINWSHCGIGALGADLACFICHFGRKTEAARPPRAHFEMRLIEDYSVALMAAGQPDRRGDIHRAVALWARTWNLQRCLGPELGRLLGEEGLLEHDRAVLTGDILAGCRRVLSPF